MNPGNVYILLTALLDPFHAATYHNACACKAFRKSNYCCSLSDALNNTLSSKSKCCSGLDHNSVCINQINVANPKCTSTCQLSEMGCGSEIPYMHMHMVTFHHQDSKCILSSSHSL